MKDFLKQFLFPGTFTMVTFAMAFFASPLPLAFSAPPVHECATCHADHFGVKGAHSPAADGMCSECHQAAPEHLNGSNPKAVVTNKKPEACYGCHDPIEKKKSNHKVLELWSTCSNCHNPHGSAEAYYLKTNTKDLCLSCHFGLDLSGKSLHGVIDTKQSCVGCHNPHSSDNIKLLLKTGNALCFNCHDKTIQAKDRVIPNIREKIEKMPFVHRGAQGDCQDCHQPHVSPFNRLLSDSYPLSDHNVYTEQTYALCFQCHDASMIKLESPTSTGFRNGTLNLH